MKRNHSTKYIGLDVHKKTITIAIAESGREGEVRLYGTIENTTNSLDNVLRKLVSSGSSVDSVGSVTEVSVSVVVVPVSVGVTGT